MFQICIYLCTQEVAISDQLPSNVVETLISGIAETMSSLTNQIVFSQVLGSFPKYFGFGAPRRILYSVSPQISFDTIEIIFLYKFKAHFIFVLAGYIMLPNVYFTFSLLNITL